MAPEFIYNHAGANLEIRSEHPPVILRFAGVSLRYKKDGRSVGLEADFSNATTDGNTATLELGDGTATLKIRIAVGEKVLVSSALSNISEGVISIDKVILNLSEAGAGQSQEKGYSFFKNGHQSWTASHAHRADETQMVPRFNFLNVMQDNPGNPPSGRPGDFASDLFAIIANLDNGTCLLSGQRHPCRNFMYFGAKFNNGPKNPPELEIINDLGGRHLAAGTSIELDGTAFSAGLSPHRLLEDFFNSFPAYKPLNDKPPSGWCSWYQYFAKVKAEDIKKNLDAASARKADWSFFVLDDGYPTAIGDWLETNKKFPAGLETMARDISGKGMTPGVWLAPFVARRNSRIYAEHPDWFLKNERGLPCFAGWNPNWGICGRYYGLDATNPLFRAWLKLFISRFVKDHGFRYLKLDFLYGASLPGRAYDPFLSPAERLASGLDLIREAAGKDITLLGCGCPLAPAIGRVDAMRIGPDVSPYWFAKYRYHLTRDPHALCTKFAVRSIIARSLMHRRLWFNDPDCLMLRESGTRLTMDERMTLADAVIVTGGVPMLSDDLSLFQDKTWDLSRRVFELTRICDKGTAWALDFMEREFPTFVYNTQGYLAVFNLEDFPQKQSMDICGRLDGLVDQNTALENLWTGEQLRLSSGVLDAGMLEPHSSRLFRIHK